MAGSFSSLFAGVTEKLDQHIGWHRMPLPLGMLTLIGLRDRLRAKNLYDTGRGPHEDPEPADDRYLTARTIDGTFNDLGDPLMGSYGSRFGRNVPLRYTAGEPADAILDPNPRVISRELLTRDEFQPATTLNLLAGAWIQFEVHDWFSHGKGEPKKPWKVPLEDDDPWPDHPMTIQQTRPDPTSDPDGPTTYITDDTHWWDGSQIYGGDAKFADALRTHVQGKLQDRRVWSPAGRAREVHRPDGRRRELLARPRAAPHAVHARAQRGLRQPARAVSGARRPGSVRQGPSRHLGADGEDPHRRLDAGGHRAPDDGARAARELVGPRGRAARQAPRQADLERRAARDPRLGHQPPRRPVLVDRGVRGRLPDAPADPGRFQPALDRGRSRAAERDAARHRRASGSRADDRALDDRPLLLLRDDAPRGDHAPQLPEVPPALRPARRVAGRPRHDRHPALARARGAALQPVPAALPPRSPSRASRR